MFKLRPNLLTFESASNKNLSNSQFYFIFSLLYVLQVNSLPDSHGDGQKGTTARRKAQDASHQDLPHTVPSTPDKYAVMWEQTWEGGRWEGCY